MKSILWLPSWYPSAADRFAGDFIQRHARAVAIYQPVYVIFVVKNNTPATRGRFSVEQCSDGRLTEVIASYSPLKTGIRPVDKLLSICQYIWVSRLLIKKFIHEKGSPAVVHVHVALWAGIMGVWLKKKLKIPFIITEHWTGYDHSAAENIFHKDWLFRSALKKVFTQAKLLLPVSNQLGKTIQSVVFPVHYQVVPNVVNTALFKFNDLPWPSRFRYIHVSTMHPQKNIEAILRCFGKMLEVQPHAELVMVGPAGQSLKEIPDRLGIAGSVYWRGEIPYPEVAKEMQLASALLMFSGYENQPCVILESLCCGLPVISSDVGGISEVLNASNGLLVNSEKEDDLVKAMLQMRESYTNYNRQEIANNAGKKFSFETVGAAITIIYNTLNET